MLEGYYTESRTKPRLLNTLSLISMVRYITFDQLKAVKKPYIQHIATKSSLQALLQSGLLELRGNAYITTTEALIFLKENGINTDHYQKRKRAELSEHTLKLTDALISLQHDPEFYTAFYPTFTDLEPDACVIYSKENSYKIQFIEVEIPKVNWDFYLLGKKKKYEALAEDFDTWDKWWRSYRHRVKLPMCDVKEFAFSVVIFGVDKEWGEGFEFRGQS